MLLLVCFSQNCWYTTVLLGSLSKAAFILALQPQFYGCSHCRSFSWLLSYFLAFDSHQNRGGSWCIPKEMLAQTSPMLTSPSNIIGYCCEYISTSVKYISFCLVLNVSINFISECVFPIVVKITVFVFWPSFLILKNESLIRSLWCLCIPLWDSLPGYLRAQRHQEVPTYCGM
jgi:hypothetical protein